MNMEQIEKTSNLTNNNGMSIMTFKVVKPGSEKEKASPYFAINIFKVREVLEAYSDENKNKLKESPEGGEKHYLGVIDVRGEYVPVYKLANWLGYEDITGEERSVFILTEVNNKSIGLHVSHIFGVDEKSWGEIVPTDGTDSQSKFVSSTRYNDELCYIVDVERMLHEITGIDLNKEADVNSGAIEVELGDQYILFADDQKSIRQYTESVLGNLGIKCKGFPDGSGLIAEAKRMERKDIGMIFTDLEMPEVSGHTVLKELKEDPNTRDIPIVVHSSMTVSDSKREAERLGANRFVGKVNTDSIISAINDFYGKEA